jgi:Uma2 family endonuclease
MAHAAHHGRYTIEDYVRLEAYSNVRHEFFAGQIYAMGGGTREHGALAANVIALLSTALRGRRCQPHTSDVRVRVQATGLVTYPDVSVVCGRALSDPEDKLALVNPVVVVEVLSPSTAEYDRGEKLEHYQQIEALQEVVFVWHDKVLLEVVRREAGGGWGVDAFAKGERAPLASLGCDLAVDDVYFDPLAE